MKFEEAQQSAPTMSQFANMRGCLAARERYFFTAGIEEGKRQGMEENQDKLIELSKAIIKLHSRTITVSASDLRKDYEFNDCICVNCQIARDVLGLKINGKD